ncbi:MAG TPA: rod shape-determining protein MreC [Woeseiaceae bacterium]|nr:rod shape-determining protein MreC [Woeseiaceae bacterium]
MAATRDTSSNPARIPALGFRALFLVLLSVLLMYLDHREQHLEQVRDIVGTALYPLQLLVDAPIRLVDWTAARLRSRDDLLTENEQLKREQQVIRARLLTQNALEAENARLREMLDAREQVEDRVRVAEILAVDSNPGRHSLIIDAGAGDDVYEGQALVDQDGVVGQVIEVGRVTSEALLISDPGHALPVEVNRNGLRTIAYGTGEFGRLDLPGLANNADIREGDLLVTSGLGGAFPAGYPVGVVTRVTRLPQQAFADVTAEPVAALNQVREIMLVWSAPAVSEEPRQSEARERGTADGATGDDAGPAEPSAGGEDEDGNE